MIDFEQRLAALKKRRQGIVKTNSLEQYGGVFDGAYSTNENLNGNFEDKNKPDVLNYTIGAMASVGKRYTDTCINEGNRVAKIVTSELHRINEHANIKIQGSVALDIHIKGSSDVDMLIIAQRPQALIDDEVIKKIGRVKNIANRAIYSAGEFTSVRNNSKSIAVEGGSLTMKVDIVPCIWGQSGVYFDIENEPNVGISILDSDKYEIIENKPFLHIKNLNYRDKIYSGKIKSAIRLIKNLISDMSCEKKPMAEAISSYDIAAICYSMGDYGNSNFSNKLQVIQGIDLVDYIREYFDFLLENSAYRNKLEVPNGMRKIFGERNQLKINHALEVIGNELEMLSNTLKKVRKPIYYDWR